jgi:MoaA/NifB/PqqE/SkfB family radical SAM enzyme
MEWNGGEAFLFQYFAELLDAGYKNNVKQYITSNGLLIDDKYAKKLWNII